MKWMNLFPSYCEKCGSAFKPRLDTFSHLCGEHAKEAADEHYRRERVASWAVANIEKVEALIKAEYDKLAAERQQYTQSTMAAMAQCQNAAAAYDGGVIGGSQFNQGGGRYGQ